MFSSVKLEKKGSYPLQPLAKSCIAWTHSYGMQDLRGFIVIPTCSHRVNDKEPFKPFKFKYYCHLVGGERTEKDLNSLLQCLVPKTKPETLKPRAIGLFLR